MRPTPSSTQPSTQPSDRSVLVRCDISEQPLDVAVVLADLADPRAGGVDVFIGYVRDHDAGKSVLGLDYSAHPTALGRLREVCESVAGRHDVHRVVAVHRTGTLQIGDIAVIVAAAASHRGDAFAACRDLIDTLKAEVPIWKHQRFEDGTEEWVGLP